MKIIASVLAITTTLLMSMVAAAEKSAIVSDLKITTLSTMLTELRGVGEWGYAALIEADGHTLLFDTGARPETVLKNASELGIDLSTVETVMLTHNHWDHTGGLTTLRRELQARNDKAVQTAHVGAGIFLPRRLDAEAAGKMPPIPPELLIDVRSVRKAYESLGGRFIVHDEPYELHPGIWITGPIPRMHPEKNWTPFMRIEKDGELVEDTIPEDQALVINTPQGLVIVSGCGHAGIVNTMEYARRITGHESVHAVVGGLHLISAPEKQIEWTGNKMREFGVQHVQGAHCTGINPVAGLREAGHLSRQTTAVGAVGSTFTLSEGIRPGILTR